MELTGGIDSTGLRWAAGLFYFWMLWLALRMAPWQRLRDPEQLHVFLGSCVALLLLWHMRTEVVSGVVFHLLGMTTITLMFGWSLAVVIGGVVLIGMGVSRELPWELFPLNALLTAVLPATLAQTFLVLARSLLPRNFFIFVLLNGFFAAGAIGLLTGWVVIALLVLFGEYAYAQLAAVVIPFFPMMFLPEAFINGWIVTILVAFRPHWVRSFSDALYINGK